MSSNDALYLLVGLTAGAVSGIVGIGGGIIVVPALVFLFGFTQQQAQGTTLAMLVPPIGLLAAYTYYSKGLVDMKIAALLAAGFIVGSLGGARFAVSLSNDVLQRVFAVVLIVVGVKMLMGGK